MDFNLHGEIVIATVIGQRGIGGNLLGEKKIFSRKGEIGKFSLPWLEEIMAGTAQSSLVNGNFFILNLSNPLQEEQAVTIMLEPYLQPHELIILGGGHIALPLVKIVAMLGYRVVVIDDRPEFASAARFPEADKVICCSFEDIQKNQCFGETSSVIIVTRGHRHDFDCLRQLLAKPLAYIGMIGSKKKIRLVTEQLIEEGFDAQKIDTVHMPIGIDIGAQSPEEIAVCIAAELIKVRRGGKAASLKMGCPEAVSTANLYEMTSAMDHKILKKAISSAQNNIPSALVTVIGAKGSTPRKAGARMLVYRDGRTLGTIGGGCSESEARRNAFDVIDSGAPFIYKISLDADTAAMEGMVCGGKMEVYIEPVNIFKKVFGRGEIFASN